MDRWTAILARDTAAAALIREIRAAAHVYHPARRGLGWYIRKRANLEITDADLTALRLMLSRCKAGS